MTLPNLSKRLNFKFKKKPLLVGGMAMEYYGLRKSGEDVDFIIDKSDHARLKKHLKTQILTIPKKQHKKSYKTTPEFVDLYGDEGILLFEFEIWNQIVKCDYPSLVEGAVEQENCIVISLEKLLFLKALGMHKAKYLNDVKLIVKRILDLKYKNNTES